ncbi:DUF4406 domain-containing protein [Eubacteriales bacterium OttesenSCG-928-A19]|nr:DUF4406 domain-containing protein [Eubacteriales bacterium OttesenSCG-928-A19]
MSRDLKHNGSGCLDLTAYEALQNIEREEVHVGQRPRYPRVYICSPYRGDTALNTRNAIHYCRFAVERGCFPIAPHIWLPLFLDDADPDERELGISFGLRLLAGCREVWVFGDRLSDGMRREITRARARELPIRYFDSQCEEVVR